MGYDWSEYDRRHRAFLWAVVLAPLAIVFPGSLIRRLLIGLGSDKDVAFLLVALPPMIYLMFRGARRALSPCQHCGKAFHTTWLYGNPFSRRCLHCGLPRGADRFP